MSNIMSEKGVCIVKFQSSLQFQFEDNHLNNLLYNKLKVDIIYCRIAISVFIWKKRAIYKEVSKKEQYISFYISVLFERI